MESDIKISCATHGDSDGAFVCQHLAGGERRGFHWAYDDEHPDAWCPDAWCDDCEAALDEAGEWTPQMMQRADIRLVCSFCYSAIRKKNWIQDDAAYQKLRDESCAYLDHRQEEFARKFRIREYERWDYDQGTAQLMFSSGGRPVVICDVAFAGSLSTSSDTWLWSWANESNAEGVKARMREVRAYGEKNRYEPLAGAFWPAHEADGWQMTSIAAFLLDAIGAYRAPNENGFLFMVIMKASWAQ
ncbi:MAG TPA: hypothetical protein VFP37_07375 [Steroidobacteraceae bacterium]|nr:hypothetical protein [Steroidobacteraceae bacterium]